MVENTTETAFAFGFRNKRPTAVVAAFSRWYFTTAAAPAAISPRQTQLLPASARCRAPPRSCVVHAGQPL